VAAARPILDEEARALGETVFLMAPRSAGMLVLDKAEGVGFLHTSAGLEDRRGLSSELRTLTVRS
jgi:DNA-binding IclR family transcriptional regulator